jgi:N-acyl-D-amino-acid deacylase
MQKYDLLIKEGTIIDGAMAPRYVGDIAIKDGIIEKIGRNIGRERAASVIEAAGKIVAPGVIDPHTHYDAQVHWDPYCTNSSWHGVTTVGVGNCGFGFAPCAPEMRERYMLMMENTEQVPIAAQRTALPWDWEDFPEWIEHLKRVPKGINIASFLPLNPLLIYTMGVDAAKSRPANRVEMQAMKDHLNRAMDAGAIGFAFSYHGEHNSHCDYDGTPMPTDIMSLDNVYELAEVLRERDQGCIQANVESVNCQNGFVAAELARRANRPILHNIVGVFESAPQFHTDILKRLDEFEREGLPVYSNSLTLRGWLEVKAHQFTGWDTAAIFREFSTAGDIHDKLSKASDADYRRRLREQYDPKSMHAPLESYILGNAHGAEPYAAFEGRTLGEIAQTRGVAVTDLLMQLLVDTKMDADLLSFDDMFSRNSKEVAKVLKHKRVIPGNSDGGAHPKFWSGGQYSTDQIMWMVREEGLMTLEELHHKLSQLPAHVLGLNRRGLLIEGFAADLYVYDFERLNYQRDKYDIEHSLPGGDWRRVVRAQGVEAVVVNGQMISQGGVHTGALPGRLVSNGGAEVDARMRIPLAQAAA